ncbi:unnamed protein product [Camellia sinensis]
MADVNASSIRKLYASISEKKKMSANWRYTYIHDDHKDPLEAIDTHRVVVRRSSARTGLVYLICSSSPNNCRLLLLLLLLLLSFLLKGTTPTSENANTGLEVFVCHHQQPRDCQPI